jgi:MFS family permease
MNLFSKILKLENLSFGLKKLYFHKVARDFAVSFLGMFGPLLIYEISGSLQTTLLYYLLVSSFLILILPFAKHTLGSGPLNFFLFLGTAGAILYYVLFYFLEKIGSFDLVLVIPMILILALLKFFYWVPYHIEFSNFVDKHHKGRQLSFLSIIVSLVKIFTPVISGWVIYRYGWSSLFGIAIFFLLISLWPIKSIPKIYESYKFSYLETYRKFFSKKHFKTNMAYMADGFQSRISFVVWPIFIFQILQGDYLKTGLVSTAIILISTILSFLAGEMSDKSDKKKMIKSGSLLYALGWIFKALVMASWQIFVVGIFHDLVRIFLRTPFDSTTYDIAADQGHYVDEFSVLREMAIHAGAVLSGLVCILALFWVSAGWLFLLSALATLFMNFISKEEFYLASTRKTASVRNI